MYWSAGATDPILSKSKKNITKFWLISFLKKILHYVLLHCLLFLDKNL